MVADHKVEHLTALQLETPHLEFGAAPACKARKEASRLGEKRNEKVHISADKEQAAFMHSLQLQSYPALAEISFHQKSGIVKINGIGIEQNYSRFYIFKEISHLTFL